jgi:hypothetical protein
VVLVGHVPALVVHHEDDATAFTPHRRRSAKRPAVRRLDDGGGVIASPRRIPDKADQFRGRSQPVQLNALVRYVPGADFGSRSRPSSGL